MASPPLPAPEDHARRFAQVRAAHRTEMQEDYVELIGDLIEATGEVVKAGKSVIFVRGEIFTGKRMLMTFSGVIKRVNWRA